MCNAGKFMSAKLAEAQVIILPTEVVNGREMRLLWENEDHAQLTV